MAAVVYFVFGNPNPNVKAGGALDLQSSHYTIDEAVSYIDGHPLAWWNIAARTDEGLNVVKTSDGTGTTDLAPETENPAGAPVTEPVEVPNTPTKNKSTQLKE